MNAPEPIVYLVDDDPAVLKSLVRLLSAARFKVASFGSPRDFLDQHDPRSPGCLVLDMAMPELDGLDVQEALAAKGCARPVIFLTAHGDIPMSVRAIKRGAVDFLTKPVNDEALIQAIGAAFMQDSVTRQAQAEFEEIHARLKTLTPREREVLIHVASGQLNKQIAADLGTVERTIKAHRARVMEKLQVNSLAELLWLVERAGIRDVRPQGPVPGKVSHQ